MFMPLLFLTQNERFSYITLTEVMENCNQKNILTPNIIFKGKLVATCLFFLLVSAITASILCMNSDKNQL